MGKIRGLRRRPGLNIWEIVRAVPTDLRGRGPYVTRAGGEKTQIVRSLRTTDLSEAKIRLEKESARISQEFEKERFKIQNPDLSPVRVKAALRAQEDERLRKLPVSKVNVEEVYQSFFVELEKEWGQRISQELAIASKPEIEEATRDLVADVIELQKIGEELNHVGIVHDYFRKLGIKLVDDDPSRLQNLTNNMRLAKLENGKRNIARMRGEAAVGEDVLFSDLSARDSIAYPVRSLPTNSLFSDRPNPRVGICTISDLCERHWEDFKKSAKRGSLKSFPATYRILEEVLGEKTPVAEVTQEDIRTLLEYFENYPKNAKQRLPELTFSEAVEYGRTHPELERISRKTQKHYLDRIRLVFSAAENYEWIESSPVKRHFSSRFKNLTTPETKQFTVDELNQLFRAPLYTGCVDDMRGYKKPGPNHPRRGRFWLPLLAIFQGVRLAEGCQLYCHDVGEEDGIPFISLTPGETEDEQEIKSLKNKNSERKFPIHPELIRIGFLNYVEVLKERGEERLFPEILPNARGSLSENTTKWFRRFVKSVFGRRPSTFHGMRHLYRDELRNSARTTADIAEALGGWGKGGRSLEAQYGKGYKLKVLREEIEKLEYEGLDLNHLYQSGTSEDYAGKN